MGDLSITPVPTEKHPKYIHSKGKNSRWVINDLNCSKFPILLSLEIQNIQVCPKSAPPRASGSAYPDLDSEAPLTESRVSQSVILMFWAESSRMMWIKWPETGENNKSSSRFWAVWADRDLSELNDIGRFLRDRQIFGSNLCRMHNLINLYSSIHNKSSQKVC